MVRSVLQRKLLEELTDERNIAWLLEKDNPSVRYFTLTQLLGRDPGDGELEEARRDIMRIGTVPAILNKQHPDGYWGDPDRFYRDKYGGTAWQLMILAELGADPADDRIRRACTFILENSQEDGESGFSYDRSRKHGGGLKSGVIPCLTGNMAWALTKLGWAGDPRVERAIGWICRYQRADDGKVEAPTGGPYDRYEMCWGKHTCHMGVVKALKALSAIPPASRNGAIRDKIEELVEYLLIHHIHKKSHEPDKVSKPGWLKFGFPLMYQTDVLEIAGILTDLGCSDQRMHEAVAVITSRQDRDGKWKLQNSFNGKMLVDIDARGKASKWITLKALNVLMKFYSFRGT